MLALVAIPERCTGCRRCELACSFAHYKVMNPAKSAIHVIRDPHAPIDAPIFCMQCGLCIDSCPQKALYRDEKIGAVLVNFEKCDGCGLCVVACPYGAIMIDKRTKKVIKCDLCKGEPACVKACPEGALLYVDVNVASYYKRQQYAVLHRVELRPMIPYPR